MGLEGPWLCKGSCLGTDHQPFMRHELNSAAMFCHMGPPMATRMFSKLD